MTHYWQRGGDPGYWSSRDGRFRISPQYEGTTRPQSYLLSDTEAKRGTTFDRVSDAKAEAFARWRRSNPVLKPSAAITTK